MSYLFFPLASENIDLTIETRHLHTCGLKFACGQDCPVADTPSLWDQILRSEFCIRRVVGYPISWHDSDFRCLPEASWLGGDCLCTCVTSVPVGQHFKILAMM